MKIAFRIAAFALLLVTPSPCFADWGIAPVSKELATKLGVKVRSEPAGPNHVRVEFEFKTEGESNNFTEAPLKNLSGVELRVGDRNNPSLTAHLQEDRSKPGRVVVGFTADRAQLDKLTLWVYVPGVLGGDIYDLRVKDFIEPKKGR
jgi:hypothetical protein